MKEWNMMFIRQDKTEVTYHIGWSTFEYEGREEKAICEKEKHVELYHWLEWLVLTELEAKGSSFLECCRSRSEVKDHESLAYEAFLSVILTLTPKHWRHALTTPKPFPAQLVWCSSLSSLPSSLPATLFSTTKSVCFNCMFTIVYSHRAMHIRYSFYFQL